MNIKDVNDKIKNIENEIGAMVEQKLKFSDASMEQIVFLFNASIMKKIIN